MSFYLLNNIQIEFFYVFFLWSSPTPKSSTQVLINTEVKVSVGKSIQAPAQIAPLFDS